MTQAVVTPAKCLNQSIEDGCDVREIPAKCNMGKVWWLKWHGSVVVVVAKGSNEV